MPAISAGPFRRRGTVAERRRRCRRRTSASGATARDDPRPRPPAAAPRHGASRRALARPERRRLGDPRLPLRRWRDVAGAAAALHDARDAAARRGGRGQQRRAAAAWHQRDRQELAGAELCRGDVRAGPTARPGEILRDPARRHRARRQQQAERRAARQVPALPLRRHGRPAASAARPSTWGCSTCGWCSERAWAACTPGCGPGCTRR